MLYDTSVATLGSGIVAFLKSGSTKCKSANFQASDPKIGVTKACTCTEVQPSGMPDIFAWTSGPSGMVAYKPSGELVVLADSFFELRPEAAGPWTLDGVAFRTVRYSNTGSTDETVTLEVTVKEAGQLYVWNNKAGSLDFMAMPGGSKKAADIVETTKTKQSYQVIDVAAVAAGTYNYQMILPAGKKFVGGAGFKKAVTGCDESMGSDVTNGKVVPEKAEKYRGCQYRTMTGRTCQKWSAQTPQKHGMNLTANPELNDRLAPQAGVEDSLCRNPDGSGNLWCYTTDKDTRWEYCVPKAYPDDFSITLSGTSSSVPTVPKAPSPMEVATWKTADGDAAKKALTDKGYDMSKEVSCINSVLRATTSAQVLGLLYSQVYLTVPAQMATGGIMFTTKMPTKVFAASKTQTSAEMKFSSTMTHGVQKSIMALKCHATADNLKAVTVQSVKGDAMMETVAKSIIFEMDIGALTCPTETVTTTTVTTLKASEGTSGTSDNVVSGVAANTVARCCTLLWIAVLTFVGMP